jgi:hypothetical protein
MSADHTVPHHVRSCPDIVFKSEFSVNSLDTYYDFHGDEKTRSGLSSLPLKDAFVIHFDTRVQILKLFSLKLNKAATDLDDVVTSSFVHVWVPFLKEIQYIHC